MVSRSLSDNVVPTILPGRQSLTDTRRLFSGVRILSDGQLHISLDGLIEGPEDDHLRNRPQHEYARCFLIWLPCLEASWSGWIAMTPDQLPRVHQLAPGVFAGLGYSGRGIAAATFIGRELAERACRTSDKDLAFPLSPLKPIVAHRFASLAIGALVGLYRVLDRIDDGRATTLIRTIVSRRQ
jgi:glycine/D-amino acid oxidase-like deaminating enzyme